MTPCKEKKATAERAPEMAAQEITPVAAAAAPVAATASAPEVAPPAHVKAVKTDVAPVKDSEVEERATLVQLALKRKQLLEVPFGLYCNAVKISKIIQDRSNYIKHFSHSG